MTGRPLASAAFWALLVLITLSFTLVAPPVALAVRLASGQPFARLSRWCIWGYGRTVSAMLALFVPVRMEGARGRIGDAPRIFVFNHASFLDLFLITLAVPPDSAALAKGWPFKVPVYGPVMRLGGYVNVEEHSGEELLRRAALLLERGVSLAVFPEGSRSRSGELGRFRSGAFKLAVEAGAPVRPVAMAGAGDVLAPGRYLLGAGEIRIRALEDVSPASYHDVDLGHAAMRGHVRDAVRAALAAPTTTA